MLKIFFLIFMMGGIPVAIAMAGASLAYIMVSGNLPPSRSTAAFAMA